MTPRVQTSQKPEPYARIARVVLQRVMLKSRSWLKRRENYTEITRTVTGTEPCDVPPDTTVLQIGDDQDKMLK